jgi:hypothetical protein
MTHLPKIAWISFLAAAFVFPLSPTATAQNAQIRHVSVVKSGGTVQIQIETSKRVVPLTEVVTDPDRLVIDFADAVPGPELRAVPVNQGEVKAVRVGRVTSNPPVTRVVVDFPSVSIEQVGRGEDWGRWYFRCGGRPARTSFAQSGRASSSAACSTHASPCRDR